MTVEKKALPPELIDSLLSDYKKPEDLIGEDGLLKQLTKMLVERALEAEVGLSTWATPRMSLSPILPATPATARAGRR